MDDLGAFRDGGGSGAGSDCGSRMVHSSIELCRAAGTAISPTLGRGRTHLTAKATETPMQHFHVGNLDKIKDAPADTWATVHRRDVVTLSELARRGFHLIDMSGEFWTMHREG